MSAYSRSGPPRPLPAWLQLAVLLTCAIAVMATSPPRVTYPRDYARWRVLDEDQMQTQGALQMGTVVSKSGKSGFGLSLCIYNNGQQATRVAVSNGRTLIGQRSTTTANAAVTVHASASDGVQVVPPGQAVLLYVPFVFDNQKLWNRGLRDAVARLQLTIDGAAVVHAVHLVHQRPSYHRAVHRDQPAPPHRAPPAAIAPCLPPSRSAP